MEIDNSTWPSAAIWLVMMVLLVVAFYRAKTRRRHIGSAAAGAVYDLVNQEKRNAIEVVADEKAGARDFEHADDKDTD